jgi:hypothetical protein
VRPELLKVHVLSLPRQPISWIMLVFGIYGRKVATVMN